MTELPEERQARALKVLIQISQQRADLLRRLEELAEPLKKASLIAADAGVAGSRVIGIAGVSPKTFYKWKSEQEANEKSSTARES